MKEGVFEIESFQELHLLRQETLGKSDFEVEEASLAITELDRIGKNLGYYEKGELVSALRLLPVNDSCALEEQLDFKQAKELALNYPGIVVGKAGTRKSFRSKGHIKYLFEEAIKKLEGFNFIAMTMKPSNPLVEYVSERNFTRYINPEGWHRFGYHSRGETFVFIRQL